MTVDTDQFQTLSAAVLRMADCLTDLSAVVGQLAELRTGTVLDPAPQLSPCPRPALRIVRSAP